MVVNRVDIAKEKKRILDELLELINTRAVEIGRFTLSSGSISSHYINLKEVTLDSRGSYLVGSALMRVPEVANAFAVGGLALGAAPIVSAVTTMSEVMNNPVSGLLVRKEPKGHGTMAYIEGPELEIGNRVTVVEDVTTTGKSALKAVDTLRDAGYKVDTVVTILDREEGADLNLEPHGIELISIFQMQNLTL